MQAALFEMPRTPVPPFVGRAKVSESDTRHIVNAARGMTSEYDVTLNPYRGCSFGCSYCYAACFVPESDLRANWGHWVEVKSRAVTELRAKGLYNKKVYLSSATDPYQPIEARVRMTRQILEELLRVQARVVIQTRSPLVTRDMDLLRQFTHLRVNLSITTDDDEMRQKFEPNCASIERRLIAVRQLRSAGIRTAVCITPMLPLKNPVGFARELRMLAPEAVAASYFHESDRPFSANTRDEGLRLVRELGWNREAYLATVRVLRRELPNLSMRGEAFLPV